MLACGGRGTYLPLGDVLPDILGLTVEPAGPTLACGGRGTYRPLVAVLPGVRGLTFVAGPVVPPLKVGCEADGRLVLCGCRRPFMVLRSSGTPLVLVSSGCCDLKEGGRAGGVCLVTAVRENARAGGTPFVKASVRPERSHARALPARCALLVHVASWQQEP